MYLQTNIKTTILFWLLIIVSIHFNAAFSQEEEISNDSILKMIDEASSLISDRDTIKSKKGIFLLSKAEHLLENSTDSLLKVHFYRKRIEFLLINKNLEEAKRYLDKTENILKEKDLPLQYGLYLELLGVYKTYSNVRTHNNYNKFRNEAIETYIKAEKILRKHGTPIQNVDVNYNLALNFNRSKQWEKSNFYCLNLKSILTKVKDDTAKKHISIMMLVNYSNLKDKKNAIKYVSRVQNYLKTEKNLYYLSELNKSLGIYYNFIKSYNKASYHLKKATKYNQEYSHKSYERKSKAPKVKNKLETEQQRVKMVQAERELHKTKLQQSKIIGISALLLILLLIIFTSIFYKNVKYKEYVNLKLKDNNTKLTIANTKAEKALEERYDFLKTITHELRTPINSIIGISYILNSVDIDEEYKKQIKTLNFSGNYLLAFVNNIINLNNLKEKKSKLLFETENLKDLLNSILETYKLNETNNNKLHCEIDNNIPKALLLDHLKTSQIIINLLNNAFKFTKNGDIYLSVKLISKTKNKANIQFIIRDTGIGISKEKKEKIFLPYNQGDENTHKKYGGSGIGLAVVKDILTLYETSISVESKLNAGTIFSFNIDFKIPKPQQEDKKLALDCENKIRTNAKILLVEDNKINQVITRKIIQGFGLNCDIASNGFEAISMSKNKTYNLILMDIMMPEIDGFETTKRIKKEAPNTNIVALTALSEAQNDLEFKNAGIQHILTKPLHPDKLYHQIIKHLKLNTLIRN